jgi:predicted extracellular nuclease
MEDPVTAVKAAGYTNLTEAYIGANAYSCVFEGYFGYLDHVLGDVNLVSQWLA